MKTNKYIVEALLFASYVLFGMCWVAGAVFIPQIMKELDIKDLAAGSNITNAVSAAKIVGTFIAAGILAKLLAKKAVALAMLLMAVAALTPFAPNYEILLVIRFLMGLGGALLVVYFSPLIMQWFSVKERPVVNGINSVAFNVGTGIILFFLADMVSLFGDWKKTLFFISIGSIIVLVLWLIFGSDGASPAAGGAKAQSSYGMMDGLKEKFNWIYPLTYAGILSFYVILFSFYKNAGIDQSKYLILSGIFGTVAGIIIAQKVKRRLPVLRISGLLQLICIIGLHSKAWGFTNSDGVVVFFALMAGFFVFLPMTCLISLGQEQEGMTPEKASVTFSLFWCISYVVGTFAPFIFAKLVDLNQGDYSVAFIFTTVIASSFLIGSFFLPESALAKKAEETSD